MKRLEHFMLPEHTNALYTKEAISSISLTRDVAEKINEIVDGINELSAGNLAKTQEQDGKINKAVLYMKDNLLNSMHDLMVLLRDSGFIDDRITFHCRELISRLDNLFASVDEGTTVFDAEIIDGRYANGITYPALGDTIRNQIKGLRNQIYSLINSISGDGLIPVDLKPGYIDAELIMHDAKAPQHEVTTDLIPFDGNIYLANICVDVPADGKGWIGVTLYDADKNPISRTSEENITEKLLVNTDENVKYFAISFRTYGNGTLNLFKKDFTRVSDKIPTYHHKFNYEYIKTKFNPGYFNASGEILNPTPTGAEVYSDLIPVVPGEEYVIISDAINSVGIVGNHAGYLWGAVALYDMDGNFKYRANTFTVSEETEDKHYSFVGNVKIGAGIGFIRVCSRTYWNGTVNVALKKKITFDTTSVFTFENACSHVKSIAHRGLSSLAPENTLAAYKMAKEHGFYYVECDVRWTMDGVPVLMHDATVNRTTNGSGDIAYMDSSDVMNLDAGSWFSPAYAGEKVPTFEEFIALCKKIGLHPYIELKSNATGEGFQKLIDIVKSYGMWNHVTWIGYSGYLKEIARGGSCRFGLVVDYVKESNANECAELKYYEGYNHEVFMNSGSQYGLSVPHLPTLNSEIELCKSKGIGLELWTINDTDVLKMIPGFIGGITSDSVHAGKEFLNDI